ncbi:hypothetical protein F4561_001805 [Lipingzhangella halophila]|uniref:DUF2567 domain-containing protein n=1 Tax=Lipingzhangella halophila TaxID=1783352 RepID=A0A7W7RFH9_9ACTN|nr:hypothetical protein [Lipingzhangella halophila]MBB4930985.1 hypothetical protein [Lipingzhangella halophila]
MVRRQLAVGAAVLGSVAALGIPLGLLWWLIAPRPEVTVVGASETVPLPVSEAMFASEGYFAIIALCAGVASGYGAYLVQYRLPVSRGTDFRMVCLLGLVAGAIAGSLLAWQVGVGLDSRGFAQALAAAEQGDRIEAGLRLRTLGILLVWPFAGVMQYGLFDAVSMWRSDLPHRFRGDAVESEDPQDDGGQESDSGQTVA